MINLLDFGPAGLADYLTGLGEKPFRAKQLLRWMHRAGEADFARMSDLAGSLRAKLTASAVVSPPRVVLEQISGDGTRKWLLDVGAGNGVETVFIPEAGRGTLCVSSQVGCALACTFCSTGHQGFNRNLTTAEIVGQLWWANRALGTDGPGTPQAGPNPVSNNPVPNNPVPSNPVSNVVLMGMGEPLLNFEHVVPALELMLDDHAYGLSRRRVTVSTSGIVPAMDRLRERCPVALAVSLHAPDDRLRDELVPINRKFPLAELMAACRRYVTAGPRDFITFEYVLLDGVNDRPEHARRLVELVADVPCKFNLIPFNPFPQSAYRRPGPAAIRAFAEILQEAGFTVTTRKTRGDDIDAACGQLAGQVRERVRRAAIPVIPVTESPVTESPARCPAGAAH